MKDLTSFDVPHDLLIKDLGVDQTIQKGHPVKLHPLQSAAGLHDFHDPMRPLETATLSVNKRRAEERREWLALAVETYRRWHENPRKTDRVAWITEKVNDGLGARSSGKRIKRNTITRNLPEIEKLAKGNDHARG